jgi:hypothetical protein
VHRLRSASVLEAGSREFFTTRALSSIRELRSYINEFTEDELYAALEFECNSRRRISVCDVILAKLAELNRQHFIQTLKEKYKWPVPHQS